MNAVADLWTWAENRPALPTGDADGDTFSREQDGPRLNTQRQAVFTVMLDHQWHTLAELAELTNASEASVSARLRDLRKAQFGSHTIERRRVPGGNGLHEYRLA